MPYNNERRKKQQYFFTLVNIVKKTIIRKFLNFIYMVWMPAMKLVCDMG